METLTAIPFIVMVLGLIIWYFASGRPNATIWPEFGRIMFAFGLLVSLFTVAGKSLL